MATVLAIAVLLGSVAVAAMAPPRTEEFPGGAFYTPPGRLVAGPHGTLVRYERVQPGTLPGATTWRVMYRSESVAGDPIAVTGLVLVPDAAAPAGGRPVLTVGHGTAGIADRCAPSHDPTKGDALLFGDAIARGWLVVITDYEGLGTPGRHPYLVGASEGRAMLDAVRAARRVPQADPSARVGIIGYSQGGHAALWAHRLASTWTPELEVAGTVAGAPVSALGRYLAAPPRGQTAGFTHLLVAGLAAAHPEADPATYLTPEGVASLPIVDQACGVAVLGNYKDSNPDELVRLSGRGAEPWSSLARDNEPGGAAAAPLLVLHAALDEVIPIADTEALVRRLCAAGQRTQLQVLSGPGAAAQGHGQAQAPSVGLGMAWLAERFADRPGIVDDCPKR